MMDSTKCLEESEKVPQPAEVSEDATLVQRSGTNWLNHGSQATGHEASSSKRVRLKKVAVFQRGNGAHRRISYQQQLIDCDNDEEKKKRPSFCQAWCDMWFLLARTRITCIALTVFLLASGILLIFLTAFGGLVHCPHLTGAAVFCVLMAILSISLGLLCCCYHCVKDDDDLPFAIFCVAYCLLLLFQFVTIAGTVVVFTHIHPIGPNQPPPYEDTTLTSVVSECGMTELPLGILVICYILAIAFVMMSYFACILALGASSNVDDD